MQTRLQKYETLFVLKPTLNEDENKALIGRIKNVINEEGKVEDVEEWGVKRLAYKIQNKYREGYYVLINFEAAKPCLDSLNHVFRITEDVIRDIITKRAE